MGMGPMHRELLYDHLKLGLADNYLNRTGDRDEHRQKVCHYCLLLMFVSMMPTSNRVHTS